MACGRTAGWQDDALVESKRGPTSLWLGGGHAISEGDHFYNGFTVCAPDGTVVGRSYKANAEANVFRRERRSHVTSSTLGKLGVAICADNQLDVLLSEYRAEAVNLVLMPHAWPIPVRAGGVVSEADVVVQHEHVLSLPRLYACALGVPVVFANHTPGCSVAS